jgi:hypothetical protein
VLAAIVTAGAATAADLIEARRDTFLYEKPNKTSSKVFAINLEDQSPYLLRLAADKTSNGYYFVAVPGNSVKGWIYKSYIRRYKQQHPKYRPYSRSLYPHWEDEDGNCRDARQEVLVRDAKGPVTFKDPRECAVSKGTWIDPYSGRSISDPRTIDVDHMVPLKNAHESGAWAWTKERRQQYANDLTYEKHLLAVSASENRRKSDRGPDKYMPPNASFHCDYVRAWVHVKQHWQLEMTEAEGGKVQEILDRCR